MSVYKLLLSIRISRREAVPNKILPLADVLTAFFYLMALTEIYVVDVMYY
jgi:hypothetical protein